MRTQLIYSMLGFKVPVSRAKHNMSRVYLHLGLVITFAGVSFAASTPCVAPKALQARIQTHPTAEAYAELGNWFGEKQRYECAGQAFGAGLKRSPRSAELLYFLGLNLMRQGEFDKALEPLQKSIKLKPDVLKPHLLLATALEQLKRPVDARKEWLLGIKMDPSSELALDGASKNLLAAGDYASVIQLLGAAPKDETLILDLVAAYEGYGYQDEAQQLLEKSLHDNPNSRELTKSLITLLVSQARYEQAAEWARKLVGENAKDFDAQVLYLHVLVLDDDENQARPLAQKLLATSPHNFGVLYLNGVLENRAGNYVAARKHLEEAVTLNPNHYNSRFNLGITLAQLQDFPGAREQFEKALALGASEPQVHFEYAKVLRALGDTKLAAEQLQLYQTEQKKKANRTAAAIKKGQADKELASGDAAKAANLYREAIAAQPNNSMLYFKLSVALDRIGDQNAEMEALKKTVQLDPRMAIAHYQLGYLASLRGDFALAEEQYREAAQAAPAYVEAWIGLASILATESRFQEAHRAVEVALQIDPKNANALELQKELRTAATQAGQ